MSHQQHFIRDSLQNDAHNQSIVRVTNNKPSCSMRMSPDEKNFSIDQSAYESQISPEKLKIIQLQQKLQLSESNGVRQVRIRGMQTRNHFSNDTGGYSNQAMQHQHEMNGQDFRVGGQVISGAANGNNNNTKDTHNLRYSRDTYDFNSNIYEDDQMPQFDEHTIQEPDQIPKSHLYQNSQITNDGQKQNREVILKLINEDNPFESQQPQAPDNQVRSIASKTTGASSAVHTVYGRQRGRFTGQSGGRLSLLAAGAIRRSETTEDSQQCKYMDGNMVLSSLPMPMQSINQIIAEEEAAAEQDEKTTQKESSKHQQKESSSTPHQSEPTLKSKQVSLSDSVEDECLIGDSQSSYKNDVKEDSRKSGLGWQSIAQDVHKSVKQGLSIQRDARFIHGEEQDESKPVRLFNRVISRGSIKFVDRSNYQSQTSLKPAPAKDQLTSSNLFGVNLLEQQKFQIELDSKSDLISDGGVSGSDGNILCESINKDVQLDSQASLVKPAVTSSPVDRKSTLLIPPVVLDNHVVVPDFPPLLTTQTNMASSQRTKHSDDQVEVRRALEESEASQGRDIGQEPKLHRISTHSLLKKLDHSDDEDHLDRDDIDRIQCKTPADLTVILGQFYRKQKGDTMAVFNDDVVQLDQDDAQPEGSDGQYRRPPKNNNFFGRPTTAKNRGAKTQQKQ